VKLLERENLTADVRRLVFQLPTEDSRLWLPWGKHINLAIQQNELDMIVRYAAATAHCVMCIVVSITVEFVCSEATVNVVVYVVSQQHSGTA
jgi:Oxidoreductase FAD-binding domain